jgi:hypothetical protein
MWRRGVVQAVAGEAGEETLAESFGDERSLVDPFERVANCSVIASSGGSVRRNGGR